MIRYFISSILVTFSLIVGAQKSTLRGIVTDATTGETVAFANIFVKETASGTSTDLDGTYSLSLEPGTYNLEVSFIGFSTLYVNEVVIEAGKVNLLDLTLSGETSVLQEVVVTARQLRNTENALLLIQKKSPNLLDGISSQSFKKTGDSDAAAAIRRVTGVSVESGKHVYVRGLGDRYTKTILNGLDIPGLDPDRNSVQMDIFPSNILDNIMVYKTFTPDLPGDFTGGVINVVTKDFPEEKTMNIGIGLSYSPSMHFRNDFLSYKGGNTDFLGFDVGTRAFPFRRSLELPDPSDNNKELTRFTKLFNPVMAAQRQSNDLNKSFSFSLGNQFKLKNSTIGYVAALNYKHETTYYDEVVFNTFRKTANTQNINLERESGNSGSLGQTSAFWSAMFGGSIKKDKYKISLNALRIQNGESSAAQFLQINGRENPAIIQKDNLEYAQRTVTNVLLKGKHNLHDGKLELDWSLSPTLSEIDEPDIRLAGFEIAEGNYYIRPSVGAVISRTFRDLTEYNYSGKIDLNYKIPLNNGLTTELKFGISNTYKDRNYGIINYFFRLRQDNKFNFSGDANELFLDENIWNVETGAGLYAKGNYEPANTYDAQQNIASAYVMNTLPINSKVKAVYGLRIEKAQNWYSGQNNSGSVVYDNQLVLNEIDLLPSANVIYELKDGMNLRASFSSTLARPSFKEKSIAQIQDRISGRSFIGNINLVETHINNFDLRWENYLSNGEMIAVSAFYKGFSNPIELVAYNEASPNDFQPVNVGDASVKGLELEVRKNLSFIQGFSIGTNLTVVTSKVEMKAEEFQSRLNNAKQGESVESTREMVGQSPFIVNSYLTYTSPNKGIEANLNYNIQGKRLSIVGIGRNPDVYEIPFQGLNFKASFGLGHEKAYRISLGVNNILDSKRQREYESFGDVSQLFERYVPGRQFTFGLNYAIR